MTYTIVKNVSQKSNSLVELIAIAVMKVNVRCLRLPGRETVVFRPSKGVYETAEGEILKVLPTKEWKYKGKTYISGQVVDSYIDGSVLTPVPLKLYMRHIWDPYDEFAGVWDVKENSKMSTDLPNWVRAVLKAGKRLEFEMEQIIPGADPSEIEDPIELAVEHARMGDFDTTFDLLQKCLEEDLRCIDAYAHLGKYNMGDAHSEWSVRRAMKCYQAGVQVGEQALPPGFDGLLPWGWIDNRPFLRALHGLGLCQWRLGQFGAAKETFWRILMFDPMDSLGVRFLLPAVEDGTDYLMFLTGE